MSNLRVIRQNTQRLTLDRSRLSSFITAAFYAGFSVFWYYALLQKHLPNHSILEAVSLVIKDNKYLIIFLLAGLMVIFETIKVLRNAIFGEIVEFIKAQGAVIRNGQLFFRFSQAQNVQIREIRDSDGDYNYRLSVILKDGSKRYFDESMDRASIYGLADEIANFLNVSIVVKN